MNETTKRGRPVADLRDDERVRLIELSGKLASLESEAREVREQRRAAALAAFERGASQRAIAEALGITQQSVGHLLTTAP